MKQNVQIKKEKIKERKGKQGCTWFPDGLTLHRSWSPREFAANYEEGNGNPLQCSCLENPRDGGAWWAAVSGVAESDTTEAT